MKDIYEAATPLSQNARVYRVREKEMPGSPVIDHTTQEMVLMAKRRHAYAMGKNYKDLTARKIREGGVGGGKRTHYIEVVVVEPSSITITTEP